MTKDTRINVLNIGLMLLSCVAAFIMPFEVFLFAYAFMGPLHYLTEISWLHDRQYFTKGKHDHVILWIIGALIALEAIAHKLGINLPLSSEFGNKIIFVALAGSLLMVFVQNVFFKIFGLLFVLLISNAIFQPDARDGFTFFIGALLPTLVHVYVFTGFFILYGALKARSSSGVWSFIVFVLCPFVLFFLFRDKTFVPVTEYGMNAYGKTTDSDGFFSLNVEVLDHFFGAFHQLKDAHGNLLYYENGNVAMDYGNAANLVFHSSTGILLMRFIAFAYTYHYLNWFSKTEIIRWHKVPKARFVGVIILWVASLILYGINYSLGLNWLFFLSFCHVLLEFPLNMVSITGIGKELWSIRKTGFAPKVAMAKK
ncbi:hypothetical protein [Ferruginibacter albus]|uniref:hypothetical protein n=1 Tax=Ferruginibacter albus TaxID=2875540 RepID=UPI001CC59DBE|nr:hypothetical protein [Ferruginibacter albus]UAY51073.1 hypothetical protein K9M53_10775 [Ferruginibacter albus]